MQVLDYEIIKTDANSGPSVRDAMNNIFNAIKTQNSGTTEPTSPSAFMPWVDTSNATTHYLKLRNHSNDGWFIMIEYDVATKSLKMGDFYTKVEITALLTQLKSDIVNGSPALLDTLNELSTALGNDANFSTTMLNAISAKLALAGGVMTGAITALREKKVAMVSQNIDLATGNVFHYTITGTTAFTVSNALGFDAANGFTLRLTNAGAFAVNWGTEFKFEKATPPLFTASGVDRISFASEDNGLTWELSGIVRDLR